MADTYDRLLITDTIYIPIKSKIVDIKYRNLTLNFKIVAENYTHHCSITCELKDCNSILCNLFVWLGIPAISIGLMIAMPFMYLAKLLRKKKKNVIKKYEREFEEKISKFEHNGSTGNPLNILIELSDENNVLTKIIHFKVPE